MQILGFEKPEAKFLGSQKANASPLLRKYKIYRWWNIIQFDNIVFIVFNLIAIKIYLLIFVKNYCQDSLYLDGKLSIYLLFLARKMSV